MKSKILVDVDYDTKEPLIQLILDNSEEGDLASKTLKHFVEQAIVRDVFVKFERSSDSNNRPQLRLGRDSFQPNLTAKQRE